MSAPIALFAYNRPDHLRRVISALRENADAPIADLFVFSDAPKTPADAANVDQVRHTAREAKGFRSVTVVAQTANLGVSRSVIGGVTDLVHRFGSVIVLEDDLLPGPHFLRYMNEGLTEYREDARVISIHGYTFPVRGQLPEVFFLRGADCWGWATWKRGWDLFQADGTKLLGDLRSRGLTRAFDMDGCYPYTQMLEDQINGRNDSWAVRWYASAFLQGCLTLYPGRSQVQNIGADGSGSHISKTSVYSHEAWGERVQVGNIPVEESAAARRAFTQFVYALTLPRLLRPIARLLRR
jgi:hypothetical protein